VPLTSLKRHILSSLTKPCNRLAAFFADLSKCFDVAIGAVRLFFFGGKLHVSQFCIAPRAQKAFPMISKVAKGHPTLKQNLGALSALLGEFIIVTWHTDKLSFILGHKAVVTNRLIALSAGKALIMKLLSVVLEFLHPMFEGVSTFVTSLGEAAIVTIRAVQSIVLSYKLLVGQGALAPPA